MKKQHRGETATKHLKSPSLNRSKGLSRLHSLPLAASAAVMLSLLTGSANADITIVNGGSQTVNGDPLTSFWNTAGVVTMENGSALNQYTNQLAPPGGWVIPNNIVLSGGAGTITLRFNGNDTKWNFNGPVSSTATGDQIIEIRTGQNGNGDREDVMFSTPIPDGVSPATTGFNVFFNTQTGSLSYVNLSAVNTFTGPITLNTPNNNSIGRFVVGGERYSLAFNATLFTIPGSGSLGPAGVYPGNVSLAANTILDFNTSANQTMSGVISGVGSVVQEIAGSTLTLSGVNTYTGNTTVSGGALVLGSTGRLNFALTNSGSNKVTGAGSATFNGLFTIDDSAVTTPVASWTLVDTTTKSFGGSFGLVGFSGPVGTLYSKVNGDKYWTFDSSTGVLSLLTKAVITSFSYNGLSGTINQVDYTIHLPVANGTTPSSIAPTYALSSGSCNQTNSAVPSPVFDGITPVHYIVTDGIHVHDYTVTATILPAPPGGVSSDLRVWLQADAINSADTTDQVRDSGGDKFVKKWFDSSGYNNHASNTTPSQQPQLITNSLSGKPVLRFTQANSTKLTLGDLSAQFGGSDPYQTATNVGSGGASLNGTYLNVPTRGVTGAIVGDSDKATTFVSGSGHAMSIPYSAALNPAGDFTYEIWAYPTISDGGARAVCSSGNFFNSGNRQGFIMYNLSSTWSIRLYTGAGTASTNLTVPLDVNAWQHLAIVRSGTTISAYKNGAFVTSTTNAMNPPTAGSYTAVGARWIGDSAAFANNFDGKADEFAVYNTALTQARLQAHYENGIDTPSRSQAYNLEVAADSPVGYYRLNEPPVLKQATIFAVAVPNNDGQYNLFGNRGDNDERWVASSYNESKPGSFRGGRADTGFAFSSWPTKRPHIYSLESSTSIYRVLIDGTQIGSSSADYNAGSGVSWTIGGRANDNDQSLTGDIAELIIYNRILSPAEAGQVGTYLSNKYGQNTTAYVSDYPTWAAFYLPTNLSDPTADFDGDGLNNYSEYAFGLDPLSASSVNPITQQLDKTTGFFSYQRRATPATSGQTYTYQLSTTLGVWQNFTPTSETSDSGVPVEVITVEVESR